MEFIRLFSFEKSADGLFTESDLLELEIALITRPNAGDLIPGGKGLRKLRFAAKGHGKRGGARVIYYHIDGDGLIYLVFAYPKNEQENLTHKQLSQLIKLIYEP